MKHFYLRIASLLFCLFVLSSSVIIAETSLNQLEPELKSAVQFNDAAKVKEAVSKIANFNNEQAMKVLIDQITKTADIKYEVYWSILNGLALFTNEKAISALTDFIIKCKVKSLGTDALFILKSNRSPEIIKLLDNILKKGNYEQQLLAIEHLGELKYKKSIETLVDFLKQSACQNDELLKKRAIGSLQALAGSGVGQTSESVAQWWKQHKGDEESALIVKESGANARTGTAVDNMDYVRTSDYTGMKRIPKDKIIVVQSDCPACETGKGPKEWIGGDHNFDHIEKVMVEMQIPHIVVKKSEFDTASYKLDDKIAVIFDCNEFHHNKLSDDGVKKIKEYVENGGYFFSEDWEVEEVLERAFNGIISHTKYFPDMNVKVLPVPGTASHPYLKGVFEKAATENKPSSEGTMAVKKRELNVGEGKWRIDDASPDIKILQPDKVIVLMVSSELKTGDKDSGAVAVTFSFGKKGITTAKITGDSSGDYYHKDKNSGGQVMHVLSHFGHQKTADDEFSLQNLLLNFLMEATERFNSRQSQKK
jgi:hypothetical protein